MWRATRAILLHGFLAVLVIGGAAAYWGHGAFTQPGPLPADQTVIVPQGAGVAAIAGALEDAGVVEDARIFALGVRLTGQHTRLKAGEYLFRAATPMREVANLLESGKTVLRRLTIAEGLTSAEAAAALAAADGLTGTLTGTPPEGSLLPETYFYSWGEPRSDVAARMRRSMTQTLAELWAAATPPPTLKSKDEALILASIIEKETGVAAERARVAAVFHNRLKRGMRLQSDPTVAYALTNGSGALGRALTRQDLKINSPYNTYANGGLPPGPIANPGRASIEAALNPAVTQDLYFVADGNGGHVFSRTLAEHNRNVRKWRRIRDSRTE